MASSGIRSSFPLAFPPVSMSETPIVKSSRSKMPPKGWMKSRRASSYQAPPPSRWRRMLRLVFNGWTISASLILLLVAFLTLTYYWFEFSDRIDRRLLSGEVFTASAGIYSAPKMLKVGEGSSMIELIDYLKSAGYIERNSQADASRSRFSVDGEVLGVEPGLTGTIDGQKAFHSLSIKFAKDGKSVAAIGDRDSNTQINQAFLEPKILSSVAAEGDGRRKTVTFHDLPPQLVKAITVTEDRAFFEHYGVNLRGIARALWRRYETDENSAVNNQGGSSITQQLVKNLFLTREQTLTRKITEAFMSVILETRLDKQEIFTLYANQIYLGQQSGVSIYGVGEAANAYFGKDVSQLSLPEAAFVAGIIRSPNRYNPYKNPDRVQERRNQVLESMLEAGEITDQQLAESRTVPIELKQISNTKDLQGMPYFSQYVIEELPKFVADPEAVQHLRVYTSIDPDLQRMAYETVAKRLAALDKHFPKKNDLNAALVAIRPKTGEIVAMVGGRDYQANQFNRATDAMRQPGSVFKPFVYTTAINSAYDSSTRQFTAASILKDEKKVFTYGTETYSPNNFGDTFSNKDVTLRDALVHSKNVVTVDLALQLNIGRVMNLAAKAGMPKVDKAYPSMALGTAEATPLSVAEAYTTFANLGDRVAPMPITKIAAGDGRTVTQPTPDKKNVVRPDVAYIMDDMMKDVINRGTAAQAQGWGFHNVAGKTAFAGKTGTSRDGWFAGFTPELVVVVYVGFDSGDDLGMKGADSAMPIWADFMQKALQTHPEWNGDWAMPANVRKGEIDIRNGSLIRELDVTADAAAPPSPTPTPFRPSDPTLAPYYEPEPTAPEIFVTNVPAEFRRVELFVSGTMPSKSMIDLDQTPPDLSDQPSPSPTPVSGTWQDAEPPPGNSSTPQPAPQSVRGDLSKQNGEITVMMCPISGMRATSNCP
ncbi:MAG TPA: PBP1A family penicillin-binding protein, partial [Pyrinomonadaceae bacterium]|nr:PBP1A family penicillin-binding protein [Pyrinomonadaceae bacterium]